MHENEFRRPEGVVLITRYFAGLDWNRIIQPASDITEMDGVKGSYIIYRQMIIEDRGFDWREHLVFSVWLNDAARNSSDSPIKCDYLVDLGLVRDEPLPPIETIRSIGDDLGSQSIEFYCQYRKLPHW